MSLELRQSIFSQLDAITLIDPHSHINPLDPASHTLADILGYHYYTELAHSAGMPRDQIEDPDAYPREKVRRLVERLAPLENTIQYSWFIETMQRLFGFEHDRITPDNWESLFDSSADAMGQPNWADHVLATSNIESVFLTNDFDDPLQGFDTNKYIPCLRTDDLVFHFAKPETRERLANCTNVWLDDLASLHDAVGKLFAHFRRNGARACAISLPPEFAPTPISVGRASTALQQVLQQGTAALESHQKALSHYIFWLLAEYCRAYNLPFDLMIGVNRGVYEAGVYQGRDLYDSRLSLIQYKRLFNSFPDVTFPVSVLASVTNQELTSYAWIFPNVVANGHWWYSNTPTFIEHDLAARLEAVPATKLIGYYSDMYKLEFGLPKYAMYKRILAKVLAERFVQDRGWSEDRAVALGTQILRGNVERLFPPVAPTQREELPAVPVASSAIRHAESITAGAVATTAGVMGNMDSVWGSQPVDTLAEEQPQTLTPREDFIYKPSEETEQSLEDFSPSETLADQPLSAPFAARANEESGDFFKNLTDTEDEADSHKSDITPGETMWLDPKSRHLLSDPGDVQLTGVEPESSMVEFNWTPRAKSSAEEETVADGIDANPSVEAETPAESPFSLDPPSYAKDESGDDINEEPLDLDLDAFNDDDAQIRSADEPLFPTLDLDDNDDEPRKSK